MDDDVPVTVDLPVGSTAPWDPWRFGYEGFDPGQEGLREALCTVGNGYLAVRGSFVGSQPDGVHYPATYVAGCYNRLTSEVAGRSVENESIVKVPDWLQLQVAVEDGGWFSPSRSDVLDHRVELDLRHGLLLRRLRFRDREGRTTRIVERRFAHMDHEHLAAVELGVVAEDWSGRLHVRSGIDAGVENRGVERYAALASRHLEVVTADAVDAETLLVRAVTNTTAVRLAVAARTRTLVDGAAVDVVRATVREDEQIAHEWQVHLEAGAAVTLEKVVSIRTSRDVAGFEPGVDVVTDLEEVGSFETLLHAHLVAWAGLWDRFRLELEFRPEMEQTLRLHLFHLLQTVSPNSSAHDVGVPPRGLHGEAYRGLIMWDEIFILPTLDLRVPSLTRALLGYRYHRLPAARRAARREGHRGAMFPWQSGSNGDEVSQVVHLNPRSGRWVPDPTHLQRHIGLAVAYNVWQYHQTTGDDAFLHDQGAEILLDVARFFASLATYDPGRGRYVIRGVVGPDEFHTGYPSAAEPGLDNNAYTNVMAAWLFRRVLELHTLLDERRWVELTAKLGIQRSDLEYFEQVGRWMYVPFHDGVISQYEGYEELEELDWERLRREHGDIQRLDRILEAEGDTPNRYKASKQADVLMLFYLLSADELRDLLGHLGYALDAETVARTVDYYLARTTHGSTLSSVVHGWVLARRHRERALEYLTQALASDVNDVQGGTTREGVHLAAMAGSVDLILRCFPGLEMREGVLRVDPVWPEALGVLEFGITYRGHPLTVRVSGESLRLTSAPGDRPAITVCSPWETFELAPGSSVELHHRPAVPRDAAHT